MNAITLMAEIPAYRWMYNTIFTSMCSIHHFSFVSMYENKNIDLIGSVVEKMILIILIFSLAKQLVHVFILVL